MHRSHPGFFGWWKHHHAQREAAIAEQFGCGPQGYGRRGHHDERVVPPAPPGFEVPGPGGPGDPGGRGFGGHGGHGFGGPRGGPFQRPGFGPGPDDFGAGLGVRRPLRFLAHKLELEEDQVEKLATTLDRLKTERAQAEVDQRRRTGSIADAFASPTLDVAALAAASSEQIKSAERLEAAVQRALGEIHAMLDDEQRRKLAYLLRTGMLAI